MAASAPAYATAADTPVLRVNGPTSRPPAHDPTASPSMNTDRTTDRTGAMMPNDANASRVHTTWSIRLEQPETKNRTKRVRRVARVMRAVRRGRAGR